MIRVNAITVVVTLGHQNMEVERNIAFYGESLNMPHSTAATHVSDVSDLPYPPLSNKDSRMPGHQTGLSHVTRFRSISIRLGLPE